MNVDNFVDKKCMPATSGAESASEVEKLLCCPSVIANYNNDLQKSIFGNLVDYHSLELVLKETGKSLLEDAISLGKAVSNACKSCETPPAVFKDDGIECK